ncbi:MAG: hypothetical protein E6Q33_01485 [Neisseriales bacterium]|nr:MAG: hypothetical protein E6Q33_01485 [Neisseriales bacterium]
MDGNGHYIFVNGDCIYGDLVSGVLKRGVYISGDGINRYEGEFLKTDFHGKGQ